MRTVTRFLLPGAALLLPACSFGPSWLTAKPDMPVPAEFRGGSAQAESMADLPWQQVLRDPSLSSLLSDVLNNNRTLEATLHNVRAAEHAVTVANAPLFPWFGYNASSSKGANQANGATVVQSGGATKMPGAAALTASWELDLWGKTRKGTESAEASAQEAEEMLNNLRVSLIRQVACGYLNLVLLDEQLRIARNSVVSYQETLELFGAQLEGGIANKLQTTSAEAALKAAEAEIPQLEYQIRALENTLCALAGRAPGSIARKSSLSSFAGAAKVAAGIPASILSRRPDIRAKEQAMRAANAEVGVAIANYFPSISLTGAMGYASVDLRRAALHPTTGWGVGANLTGPLFRAGQLRASEKIKRENFLSAKAEYEQTVYDALAEISSTLIQREKLREVISRQEAAVAAYEESLALSRDRYKQGLSSYYEVLTAQQGLFPAQKLLASYRYQYAACIPTLYTQLGGGWEQQKRK